MRPRILVPVTLLASAIGLAGVADGLMRLRRAEDRLSALEATPTSAPASPAECRIALIPAPPATVNPPSAQDPISVIEDRLDHVTRRVRAGGGPSGAAPAASAPPVLPPRDVLVRISREEYLAARRAAREQEGKPARSREEQNRDQGEIFLRELLGLGPEQARAVMEYFEGSEKQGERLVEAFITDYDSRGLVDTVGLGRQLDRQYDEDMTKIRQMLTPQQFGKFEELVDLFGDRHSREHNLADGKVLKIHRRNELHVVEIVTPPPAPPSNENAPDR